MYFWISVSIMKNKISLASINKLLWFVQRLIVRIYWNKLLTKKTVSTRKNKTECITTLSFTDDPLNYDSYKTDIDSNFRKIVRVQNVKLNPNTGVVWLRNKILTESSVWDIKDLVKWEPNPLIFTTLSGSYKSLPDNGYFHFLIEDLPRYIEVHKYDNSSKTILGTKSPYVISALNFLSPQNYISLSEPVRVENLILSEKINGKLFSESDLDLLNNSFSSLLAHSNNNRIFISRNDPMGQKYDSRGLQYRQQIESIFKKFEFQIIFMENLSFIEQIKLAKSASIIAGFHGAGLANIVWAIKGSTVIEITGSRVTNHFHYISDLCGHKYMRFSIPTAFSSLEKFLVGI